MAFPQSSATAPKAATNPAAAPCSSPRLPLAALSLSVAVVDAAAELAVVVVLDFGVVVVGAAEELSIPINPLLVPVGVTTASDVAIAMRALTTLRSNDLTLAGSDLYHSSASMFAV